MQGSITSRTRANVRDNNGKLRKKLTVYDVQYRVTDPKTGKRVKKQKRGFLTKTEAEAFLTDMNTLDRKGILQVETKLTVEQYLTQWLKDYKKVGRLRLATYENYQKHIEKYINPRIGHIQLSQLKGSDLEKMYADLRENGCIIKGGGLSDNTIATIHRVIVTAIRYAFKNDIISSDPTRKILKPPTKSKHTAQSYNVEEIRELLKIAHDTGSDLELPIALGALCGLRRGECLGIREEDIEDDGLYVHRQIQYSNTEKKIYEVLPKTQDSIRCVPLPPEVRTIIQDRSALNKRNKELLGDAYHDDGWIVCNPNGSWISPNTLSRRFAAFLKKHGFKKIRFHGLRHTCASLLLETGGADLKLVSVILGHASITTTANIYAHISNKQKQKALNKLSSEIWETKEPSVSK